jgi:hypothetical protein
MSAGITPRLHKQRIAIFFFLGLLVVATIYGAWYANYTMSGNSDDIIYPYLFGHFTFHDIILPSQHSNILKFPLYVLQSILPYTFTTFSIVNIGLVLLTVVGWAVGLAWLFGKRYLPLICTALLAILLGSQFFDGDLLGTTARNIEYLIALAFIIYMGILLSAGRMTKPIKIAGLVLGLLYSLTLAGDSFFLYTISAAIFAVTIFLWLTNIKGFDRKHLSFVMGYFIGVNILAIVIREAVKVLGISNYFTDPVFLPHILPLSHIGPSVSTATIQVFDMFNANIFGKQIRPGNSLIFLNFLLLLSGLVGFIYILRDLVRATGRKMLLKYMSFAQVFTLGVLAVAAFLVYGIYIMSDLVVIQNQAGQIVSAHQERYLTMLPLALIAGIAYLVWRNFRARASIVVAPALVILLVVLVNVPVILRAHTYDAGLRAGPIAVAQAVQDNHASVLVSGYWYGAATRFWSHNRLVFASVSSCNVPTPPINTRLSWYRPDPTVHKSALLLDRNGIDAFYSSCTDQQLTNIYGKPTRIISIKTADQPSLWLYNYDIRSKLAPFTH